jgi:phosphatidylserine/phosphatidylglycerophosphate/cardiolipin synthase-like enzyme
MGTEQNSNISLVIKNPLIAATYQAEFEHMFNFWPNTVKSEKIRGTGATLPIGRFNHNKLPAAPRLFSFTDGTMLAVHFAPTDDGEHRSVLPMIHSANAGDTLRISMFGNSGYEYIRAIQLAVARGVNVRIVLDSQQSAGAFSWLKDPSGNLLEANPYMEALCKSGVRPGNLSIKVSGWEGKNHYKAGTLTRKTGVVEAMIVGSQNWSNGGNDSNDENMVSIQNKRIGVRMGRQFNLEFEHLAEASRPPFQRPAAIPAACGVATR